MIWGYHYFWKHPGGKFPKVWFGLIFLWFRNFLADPTRSECKMTRCQYLNPSPWMRIGRSKFKKLLMMLLEQKLHVRSLLIWLSLCLRPSAKSSTTTFEIPFVNTIQLPPILFWTIWHQSLPYLGNWQSAKPLDLIPLRCNQCSALDFSYQPTSKADLPSMSTFTLVYWGFIPSFPTKGQLVL